MALIGHLQVANGCRVASAPLTAASSGPIPKAPGSAGGYLLTEGTKLPDYVVLISTLGSIEVFGLDVFFIGPLTAAIFMVTWEIFSAWQHLNRQCRRAGRQMKK